MITSLVLTVALGSQPAVEMDYAYSSEAACESAKEKAFYNTTGNYSVALDCIRGMKVSEPSRNNGEWKVLTVGLRQNTTEPVFSQMTNETLDEQSCNYLLDRMHPRLKAMTGRQFVNICIPKA